MCILVDYRTGSKELLPLILKNNVKAEIAELPFGDFCFDGNGPRGTISVGVERKTLHDMLACVEDSRYAAHQRPGMAQMYDKQFLFIEGAWKPHEDGLLMEGFSGNSWGFCKFSSRKTMYYKLFRYLLSVSMSGVIVIQCRDMFHTAYNICEVYQYFQKRWEDHTSMLQTQTLNIPSLTGKPSLVRRWAAELTGIGTKHSMDADRIFKTPLALANSDESDWMRLPGVGAASAMRIVREIMGIKG